MLAVSLPDRVGFAFKVAPVVEIGEAARVCTLGGARVVNVPKSEKDE